MNRDLLRVLSFYGLLGVGGLTVYWVSITLFATWGARA